MKKVFALILALTMIFALSSVAFAENNRDNNGEGVGTESTNVKINVKKLDASEEPVYSINIAWGNLTFAYEYTEWNDETHVFDGGWVKMVDENKTYVDSMSADITITNHSNVPVNVDAVYNKTNNATELAGITTNLAIKTGDVNLSAAAGESVEAIAYTFTVGGAPENTEIDANTVLGNITITISAVN